jgi:hypothetical protein
MFKLRRDLKVKSLSTVFNILFLLLEALRIFHIDISFTATVAWCKIKIWIMASSRAFHYKLFKFIQRFVDSE